MRLPAGWLALALVAVAAAQPLLGGGRDKASADTAGAEGEGGGAADAAQDPPSTPANKSEEVPESLVDTVMQLAVDVSRLAMELHHSGGARAVAEQRLSAPGETSLLLTFHRSGAPSRATRGLLTSPLTSQLAVAANREEVAGRAMEYESGADASLSKPLPLPFEPLPVPVVPQVVSIALPVEAEGRPQVVGGEGLQLEGSRAGQAGGEGRQLKTGGEVSQRSAEFDQMTRMMVALVTESGGYDISVLHLLVQLLDAGHGVVDAVKKLAARWRGRGRGISGARSPAQDLDDRPLGAPRRDQGSQPGRRNDHKARGR